MPAQDGVRGDDQAQPHATRLRYEALLIAGGVVIVPGSWLAISAEIAAKGWYNSTSGLPILPIAMRVRRAVDPIPQWHAAALGNWPAIASVRAAVAFGAWGQQLFPGEGPPPALGLVPVEAWAIAGALYLMITALIVRVPSATSILGFARGAAAVAVPIRKASG